MYFSDETSCLWVGFNGHKVVRTESCKMNCFQKSMFNLGFFFRALKFQTDENFVEEGNDYHLPLSMNAKTGCSLNIPLHKEGSWRFYVRMRPIVTFTKVRGIFVVADRLSHRIKSICLLSNS